ncbi:MAG: 50S ribosomal protein L6 [Nitrospinota bacterium]|nr:MAG: 50S ribosomal protein L6 [Nitrospinota bacterium]
MSRVGKRPIPLPPGVEVSIEQDTVEVRGPKGVLRHTLPRTISARVEGQMLLVERANDSKESKSLHGLTRTLLANMVHGVSEGFQKRLVIEGIGFRAQLMGSHLQLSLGYSHPIIYPAPEGIEFEIADRNAIVVKGIDKQLVGSVAAEIRSLRPPEPYKGKGIAYADEYIRRKVGKGGV